METAHKKESDAKAEFYESLQIKLHEREEVCFTSDLAGKTYPLGNQQIKEEKYCRKYWISSLLLKRICRIS